MNAFFVPASARMACLRLGPKFLLASVPTLLLLQALGMAAAQYLNARIRTIESKRVAVALMTDLVDWNKALIESRRVTITGKSGDPAALEGFRKQVATAVRQLARINAQPADAEFPQKALSAHAPEYGRLCAFMRDMGNKPGLAQDSDADIFCLGYPLANNTPSTAGIAVRIAACVTMNVNRVEVSPRTRSSTK